MRVISNMISFRFVNIVMSVIIFMVMYTIFRKLSRRLKVSLVFSSNCFLFSCNMTHWVVSSCPPAYGRFLKAYNGQGQKNISKKLWFNCKKQKTTFVHFQDDPGLGIQPIHRTCCMMNSLVLTCFPLLYFYNLLYYTDVGSVLFVLASYSCSIRNHHLKSALVSFVRIGQAMSQFRRPISLHRRSARRTIVVSISKIPTFSKHKI